LDSGQNHQKAAERLIEKIWHAQADYFEESSYPNPGFVLFGRGIGGSSDASYYWLFKRAD
jgi:hypothetical protein